MGNFIRIIIISVFLYGCAAPKFYVSNISNQKSTEKSALIYALPRTVFQVEVTFLRSGFIPGPYHGYAEKYLAIKGVEHAAYEKWQIMQIKVRADIEPDPAGFYTVSSEKNTDGLDAAFESLSDNGLIILPGSNMADGPFVSQLNIAEDEIYFKDLSVKRNLVVEKSTEYKRVFRDSMYIQVPVENETLKTKSLELKAEEAANFVIKLRKRRFKLLTGQNEGPVPANIEASINELNRIEDEYLSLFTGKTTNDTFIKVYEYTPLPEKKNDRQIIFKMSESEGIFDILSSKGKPCIIEIKSAELTGGFEKLQSPMLLQGKENLVIFRLPDMAYLELSWDEKKLFREKFSVFQFGAVTGKKIVIN
ncbi:MAG: DUF4831 family protein [Bacteroidales bacterium]